MTRTIAIGDIHGCATALDRLLQEIIENRKHSARLAFTILRIVNVRAILREVVLVPSAHYGGPEPVRSLCSREA